MADSAVVSSILSSKVSSTSTVHTTSDRSGEQGRAELEVGGDGVAVSREDQSGGTLMEPFAGSPGVRVTPNEKEDAKSTLVTWDGPDDPENPQNWPRTKKIRVTALLSFTTMTATFASSIFSSASPYIAKQYGISDEVGILGLSLYLLGFTVGPIVFGPVSEVYGRKIAILPAVFIFICFSAATATAENLQTIFISRFFAGGFASSPVSVVGGAMADFWSQRERGGAIVIYSLCVVAGPSLAPLIGSAISGSYLTWRWTEYICAILTSTVLAFNLLFLPETSAPILLTRKAHRLRLETKNWALHSAHEELDHSLSVFMHKNLVTPLAMLAREPMVTLIATYNAFAYGVLYLLFSAIPIIFEGVRGWKPVPSTLPNLATFVGTLIAAGINGYYSGKIFVRYLDTHGGKAPPEKRLPPMMIGAITFPLGFFIVGWTSNPSIHWFPSMIGFTLIGMSFLLIFQAGMNYLVDAYTRVAASAVSANTFLRSLFGATFPLFAKPLFNNLGVSWACTLLGCIAVLLGCTPILFSRYGQRLREKSKFIPS